MKNDNVPEGYELFILPPGKRNFNRVASQSQSSTCTTFTFEREDHSLGNLLKGQLLAYPDVTFAGYIMPHPLDHYFVLNVQTTGDRKPTKAVQDAIQHLISTFYFLKNKFTNDALSRRLNEN